MDATEHMVRDRPAWLHFCGLKPHDTVPDANTLWDFREALIKADALKDLFKEMNQIIAEAGFISRSGQVVDSSLVAAPRQRASEAEKAAIKEGRPAGEIWSDAPAKASQKDTDARWTVKYKKAKAKPDGRKPVDIAIPVFGYKTHIGIDKMHGIIRRQARTDREAELDGFRVVRTSLDADSIGPDEAVEACKSLTRVEQAFRQIKTGRLRIRPIFVCSEARVRARAFPCMLAYHAEWHMRRRLAPILFDEDDPEAARAQCASPVEPAKPSPSARSKATRKRAPDSTAVHSFHTLLADLSTVALNDVSIGGSESFKLVTSPTPGQKKAFDLLGVNPARVFPAAGR